MPKVETRATGRPSIHDDKLGTSPRNKSPRTSSVTGRSPRVTRGAKENQSPIRRNKPRSDLSSSEEDLDEVDRSTNMYPDLSPFSSSASGSPQAWSPEANEGHTFNDTFYSTRSQCHPRAPQKSPEKGGLTRDRPVTPEQGSQGRRVGRGVGGELGDRDKIRAKRGPAPLLIVGFIFLVLFTVFWLKQSLEEVHELSEQKPYVKSIDKVYKEFKLDLKNFINKFQQEKEVWVQLIGQIDSIMVDSPKQPAVLLVVVPEDARGTATCFIYTIAHLLNKAFEDTRFVMFDTKSNGLANLSSIKKNLDETLMELSLTHTAIIHNIENIPGRAAMIFHAYCDNENAPFKQAVIFPMLDIKGKYEEMAHDRRLDHTVDDYLTQLWGAELESKDVSAVISRVANAPILIKPEPEEKIRRMCPI
ncbi:torsin-1A-interacting protein 1-like isoform X2 [Penaeus japonicus]|uniref:torsin-1A-interacting protein 1-like isoform X2 n=1 Tax=Penaeus japonicus TaxID=27405 RepID=UPI001C70D006|nr:torsin-1A-interacting protein 1-like isoform X2 [Penaeus japonicus]